jgi:hypothetical protein
VAVAGSECESDGAPGAKWTESEGSWPCWRWAHGSWSRVSPSAGYRSSWMPVDMEMPTDRERNVVLSPIRNAISCMMREVSQDVQQRSHEGEAGRPKFRAGSVAWKRLMLFA